MLNICLSGVTETSQQQELMNPSNMLTGCRINQKRATRALSSKDSLRCCLLHRFQRTNATSDLLPPRLVAPRSGMPHPERLIAWHRLPPRGLKTCRGTRSVEKKRCNYSPNAGRFGSCHGGLDMCSLFLVTVDHDMPKSGPILMGTATT